MQLSAVLWQATDAAVAKGKRWLSDAIIQDIIESGKKSVQGVYKFYAEATREMKPAHAR